MKRNHLIAMLKANAGAIALNHLTADRDEQALDIIPNDSV